MSKGVAIQEGNRPYGIAGVSRLLVAERSGSYSVWVPKDERLLIQKYITDNGTYIASDDSAYGYTPITVNVSGAVGGPLGGVGSRIIGLDQYTGKPSIVSVRPNGMLSKEPTKSKKADKDETATTLIKLHGIHTFMGSTPDFQVTDSAYIPKGDYYSAECAFTIDFSAVIQTKWDARYIRQTEFGEGVDAFGGDRPLEIVSSELSREYINSQGCIHQDYNPLTARNDRGNNVILYSLPHNLPATRIVYPCGDEVYGPGTNVIMIDDWSRSTPTGRTIPSAKFIDNEYSKIDVKVTVIPSRKNRAATQRIWDSSGKIVPDENTRSLGGFIGPYVKFYSNSRLPEFFSFDVHSQYNVIDESALYFAEDLGYGAKYANDDPSPDNITEFSMDEWSNLLTISPMGYVGVSSNALGCFMSFSVHKRDREHDAIINTSSGKYLQLGYLKQNEMKEYVRGIQFYPTIKMFMPSIEYCGPISEAPESAFILD